MRLVTLFFKDLCLGKC